MSRESYSDWNERQDREVSAWNRELQEHKGPRDTTPAVTREVLFARLLEACEEAGEFQHLTQEIRRMPA